MRRFAVVALAFVLTGCAQVFEGNLFKNVDTPPPLSSSAMTKASLADIKSQIADPNTASAFYTQLQDNPKALTALQDNLNGKITAASAPADKIDIAQTLVLVTANGDSGVKTMVNDAITQASNLKSGGTPADAVTALVSGKSATEIAALLTQFQAMQAAFLVMQTNATSGTAVDSAKFYGTASSATQGDLAQMALVAAAADAMIKDNGNSISTLSTKLATGAALSVVTPNMNLVTGALDGTKVDPTLPNNYAYLSAVTGIVPF